MRSVAARFGVRVGLGVVVGLGVFVGVAVIVDVGLGVLVDVGSAATDVLQAKETNINIDINIKTGFDFWGCINPPLFRLMYIVQ